MNNRELINNTERIVDDFNEDIRQDMRSKRIDSTGEASNSIRTETNISGHKINIKSTGIGYMYYLDQGRRPGKFPPPAVIEQWTINKPVEISPYLVGRKISREGTEIYKNKSKGIQLEEKRREVLNRIKQEAGEWVKNDVLASVNGVNEMLIGE